MMAAVHLGNGLAKLVQLFTVSALRDLRSTLHPDGADVVQSALLDVAAFRGELQALSLEMLLLEHSQLRRQSKFSCC